MINWKAIAHRYRRQLKAELAGSKKLHGMLVEKTREVQRLRRFVEDVKTGRFISFIDGNSYTRSYPKSLVGRKQDDGCDGTNA